MARHKKELTADQQSIINNIGEQVKMRRALFDLTQTELGDLVGMPQETINRIEKKKFNMSVATVKALADALNAPFEDLLKPVDEIRRALGMPLEPRAAFEEPEKYRTKPKKAGRPPSGANKKAA